MGDVIVMYTAPEMGHLVPMVELANLILLHHPSFSVSILIAAASPSPSSYDTFSPYISSVTAITPSLSIHHLPPSSAAPASPHLSPFDLIALNNPNLRKTLLSISQPPNPTIIRACILDFLCNDAVSVSMELGIPTYYFFTTSAHGLASLLFTPTIYRNTSDSLKDVRKYIRIPGFASPVFSSDLPTVILDRKSKIYEFFHRASLQMSQSVGIIVNTFNSMEEIAIRALKDGLCVTENQTPPIFPIGPLVRDWVSSGTKHECLTWLDSQPEKSVVFLCFGSLGLFSAEQLAEMAAGLEKSGARFLWVVRIPPPVAHQSLGSLLPEGFLGRTEGRGLVVESWAPQVEVLSHASVGGFLTHCGWNSVLESVCAGVPMVAWPLYREQRMNRQFLVEELKVAVTVNESEEDGLVRADELAERVTELMDSESGKAVRERVREMRDDAVAALREGGSSLVGLANFVESLGLGERVR